MHGFAADFADGTVLSQISAEEMKNIAEIASGKQAAIDKAYGEGIHVAGERFVVAKVDDGSVYARKVCPLSVISPQRFEPG